MSKPEKKEEGVKVFLRIRPFNRKEITEQTRDEMLIPVIHPLDESRLEFLDPAADFAVRECMTFDEIFWSVNESQLHEPPPLTFATQEYVYSRTGHVCVDHAFEGYNSCMLAYGQTGSGKTHSMLGSRDDEGIIPRVCKELFATVAAKREDPKNKGTSYKITVSFLEIYNEKVKDLLSRPESDDEDDHRSVSTLGTSPKGTSPRHDKQYRDLRIRLHSHRGPFVEGLTEEEVSNWEDCNDRISYGFSHRTTKATNMNAVSSRSHAIFKLELTQSVKVPGGPRPKQVHTISSLNLVDLAGSERASRTGATGDTLTEGIAINQSLTVLRKVIEALMENGKTLRESHEKGIPYKPVAPPYRESTLTWLLSESFGGNSKTMMIAAASPHESNAEETLQTLKYALKTREIVNTVTRNEDKGMRMLREKNEEIERLKEQLQAAANNNHHSPQDEARVHEIQQKLRAEEEVKKQLMEEHEKLTRTMEQKEEQFRQREEQMRRTTEELRKQQQKAQEEADQRARTQRASDIMSKWTRGVALSIDNQKKKKLKEVDRQLREKEEELQRVAAEKRHYEEREEQRMEEHAQLERQFSDKKATLDEALHKERERLRYEHESVVAVYKDTLEADNERLQRALHDLRSEYHQTKAQLELENERLIEEITRTAGDCKVVKEGLGAAASTLESTKSENRFLQGEVYDLKEANVRLREENSKLRLGSLKASEGGSDPNHAAQLALKRDIKSLEARVTELLDDRAARFKEIALLKADKKALSMENEEYRLAAEQAKGAAFTLESKLQAKSGELDALKKQVRADEERRRSGERTWEEQQIIELQAQLDLARRSRDSADGTIRDAKVENETLRLNIRRLVEEHSLKDVDERGFDERFPASLVDLGDTGKDIPLGGTVRVGWNGGGAVPDSIDALKVADSKVAQCRKTLLELRMQPPEPQDPEALEERQDALQQRMSQLLEEVSRAIVQSYETVRRLPAEARDPLTDYKNPFDNRSLMDTHSRSPAEVCESPTSVAMSMPAAAELQTRLERAEGEKAEALRRLGMLEDEMAELRDDVVPASLVEHLNQELEKALQDLHELQQSRPDQQIVERIIEVPAVDTQAFAELQDELEDAKAEIEFQEEMKVMLEDQLSAFQDFEERYQKLQAAVAALEDGEGEEAEGGGADVDLMVERLGAMKELVVTLKAESAELKQAKAAGLGKLQEDYEFCQTKGRVLEETLKEVTSASASLEDELCRTRYDLIKEQEARAADNTAAAQREQEMLTVVHNYEDEVKEGFQQCKDRHAVVWRELTQRRRAFEELRKRAHVRALLPEDVVSVECEFTQQQQGVSGSAPPELEGMGSPELTVEEILLSRHEQLSLARKSLTDTMHAYAVRNPSPQLPQIPDSVSTKPVVASPTLIITEPSPDPEPVGMPAPLPPRFAYTSASPHGSSASDTPRLKAQKRNI